MGLIETDEAVEHFRRVVEATERNTSGEAQKVKDAYNDGFVDALEFCIATISTMPAAQPEPTWIPCDEKIPENDATVLVTVAFPSGSGIKPKVFEMSYYNGRWYRNDMLISPWWVVVAWRPKPKPWKGHSADGHLKKPNSSKLSAPIAE